MAEAPEVDQLLRGAAVGRPAGTAAPSPRLAVTVASSKRVEDVGSLPPAIQRRLPPRSCGLNGKLRLRLTLDRKGTIVAIEFVSGNAKIASCLRARLLGLRSGARATGEKAYVELTIEAR